MDTDALVKSQIVDLLRYKAERGQRSLDFDGPPAPPPAAAGLGSPLPPLTARELAHRQRMVKHMESQKSEVRSQK
jgi:hypothetical protein